MNRTGLWAGGLALILLVGVGAAAQLLLEWAMPRMRRTLGQSALRPRFTARIRSPLMGSKSRGIMTGPRSPLQGMASLTAMVRRKVSFPLTLTGRLLVMSPSPARTLSRGIAQAPSPLRMVRRSICSSPLMALCLRSCRPSPPSLWGRGFKPRGTRPGGSETEALSSPIPGGDDGTSPPKRVGGYRSNRA